MNGTPTLYVDPYGNIFRAKTIKDVRPNVPTDKLDDGSDLFFEPVDDEDLKSASAIAGDSSDENFRTDRFSAPVLNWIARVAPFAVVFAAIAALLTA